MVINLFPLTKKLGNDATQLKIVLLNLGTLTPWVA